MHNLETGNISNNSNAAKDYIIGVLNQLLIDYKNTREERRKLMDWQDSKDLLER